MRTFSGKNENENRKIRWSHEVFLVTSILFPVLIIQGISSNSYLDEIATLITKHLTWLETLGKKSMWIYFFSVIGLYI